jgi:hypothetical protein
LLGVRGHADVWKSKAEWSAARKEYLMTELHRLSEQLQCELFELLLIVSDAPVSLLSYFLQVLQVLTLPQGKKISVLLFGSTA